MNRRRNLMAALLAALVMLGALWPLCQRMSDAAAHSAVSEKQRVLAQAQEAHEAQAAGSAVQPIMEMEEAWAIEDAREAAQEPLVTAMTRDGQALGYDAQSRTFYCTLGEAAEEWPALSLSATGAKGVQVAWIDDYSYDFPADAVAEGWRYELLAYTDAQVEYIGVVFTALPIVTLHAQETIGESYVPARMTLSAGDGEALDSAALVHTRGGGYPQQYDKLSYRVELVGMSRKGHAATRSESLLGMEADSDWLLIANVADETRVLNHLAWDLWRRWNPDGDAFGLLESRMVEVFVDDEYMGLYQLMQRVDAQRELARMGGNTDTDVCMRVITEMNIESRPYVDLRQECGVIAELRSRPRHMTDKAAMAVLEPFFRMNADTGSDYGYDDEEFARVALESADIPALMSYFAFAQAASFGYDNVFNNVYLWAMRRDGQTLFYMSPWDMDCVFRPVFTDRETGINLWQAQLVRMLSQDVGGCRAALWAIWREKTAWMTDDWIYQWFTGMEEAMNASGAYRRDMLKWTGEEKQLNLAGYAAYMISHRDLVTFTMSEMWPEQE
ncbi:MAG: CotH kinase family protein [Candidatus Ventricola sp.]